MDIRVGFGYDVHRLEEGRDFILGGIKIKHTKGALGHSDADVLIHAICDALLGAANLQDIGHHFSDKDPAFKGIDSKILLKKVAELIAGKGFSIGNIDSTISLQKPKIAAYIPEMKTVLAQTINIDPDYISIKATTTEKLGFEGREEGVSAYAVVLIKR
ncbi:MAG: 2-C-methyl-D-erythritol 2,4-cyclodiphosphate synthase [Bacteroidales bacterium]|nr:2-C-methyl-D-erythritol 2,4-cyclodiphosphate synthase [Bacteroidales bacterium]